tara:strand:+ start:101 stop:826 length:726 start_codon:yes stop_codon:yes gene_type:complete
MIDLRKGDCLEVMKTIKDNSIDAIITDPPYGTTACKWDSVIDFDLMWEQLNRIIKPNGAIVLFGSEPFSSALRMSNIKNYKYDWTWIKENGTGFLNSKKQPLRNNEQISVFYKKQCTYNPQMIGNEKRIVKRKNKPQTTDNYGFSMQPTESVYYGRYPNNTLIFKRDNNKQHPTQKPIELMEYLIKTYTNESETVLDFTMGSGSTMVAAQNLKRNGIGIEQDEKYFKIAEQRIKENEFKLF